MKRLVLAPDARADLDGISRYSKRLWGVDRMRAYMAALRDRMIRLRRRPGSGKIRLDIDGSVRTVRSGRHLIFYDVTEDEVVILRVLHERMDVAAKVGDRAS